MNVPGWINADDFVGGRFDIELRDGATRIGATVTRVVTHVFEFDGLPVSVPVALELNGDASDAFDLSRVASIRRNAPLE